MVRQPQQKRKKCRPTGGSVSLAGRFPAALVRGRSLVVLFLSLAFTSPGPGAQLFAQSPEGLLAQQKKNRYIGRILFVRGEASIIDLRKRERRRATKGMRLTRFDEIRTADKTRLELITNRGTKITIYSRSVMNLYETRQGTTESRKLRLLIGQARVTIPVRLQKNEQFLVKTRSAALQVLGGADFGMIASYQETRFVVFTGQVRVASSARLSRRSYVLRERQEIKILQDQEPWRPRLMPDDYIENWFDRYYITSRQTIARKFREKETFFDRFIKRQERL